MQFHAMSRNPLPRFFAGLCTFFFIGFIHAAPGTSTLDRKGLFGFEHSGVAVRGYDTVAYFTLGRPVEGKDQFSVKWNDAIWKFSSAEHRDLFSSMPEKYAPQYGGYCAYGVANDYLVKIEPDLWTIIDDKLYLNYSNKVQRLWEKNTTGYINDANDKFTQLLNTAN